MSNDTSASSMGPVLFVGLSALALISQGQEEVELANPAVTMRDVQFTDAPTIMRHTLLFSGPIALSRIDGGPKLEPAVVFALTQNEDFFQFEQDASVPPRAQETVLQSSQALDVTEQSELVLPGTSNSVAGRADAPQRAETVLQGQRRALVRDLNAPRRPEAQQSISDTREDQVVLRAVGVTLPGQTHAVTPQALSGSNVTRIASDVQPDLGPGRIAGLPEPFLSGNDPLGPAPADGVGTGPEMPAQISQLPRPGQGPGPSVARPGRMTVVADPSARSALVDGDNVFLRTRPGLDGDEIGLFDRGEAAIVTQTFGNWARIVINGQTGWMYLRYLNFD